MQLATALADSANYASLPGDLWDYAQEDTIGGWDRGQGGWPTGCVWSVEGQYLYALVRALRPRVCVELGTFHGCSATHILSALERNEEGHLHCADNRHDGIETGRLIPDTLRSRLNIHDFTAYEYLRNLEDASVDFIFEDALHDPIGTRNIWLEAQRVIRPGGVVISHDALHFLVGHDVRAGIFASGVETARFYLIAPSDCGLAVWRSPNKVRITA